MHPSLVPQQRFDSDGRLVTRHVRPDADTSKLAPTLPAPANRPIRRQTDGTVNHLIIALGESTSQVSTTIRHGLTMMTHSEVDMVRAALMGPLGETPRSRLKLRNLIFHSIENGDDFGKNFGSLLVLAIGSRLDYHRYRKLLSALNEYPELSEAVSDLEHADPKDQQHVCDIASAVLDLSAEVVQKKNANGTWTRLIASDGEFRDHTVLDALVRYPGRTATIVDLYRKRGSIAALEEVLATANPISDGAL